MLVEIDAPLIKVEVCRWGFNTLVAFVETRLITNEIELKSLP
jgi:hypothetical protein